MIARLIHACFGRPGLAIALAAIGAVLGALNLQDLRRDVFPDLSAPIFNVIVQNQAMAPEELEQSVAMPLETALAGLPDVRRLRSSSQAGVTQVTIEFEHHIDYYRARQLVGERVAQAAADLPPGTGAPLVSSLTGRLNEILEFTLEAESGADLMLLRDVAEFTVARRLLSVPGVAAVERLGGYLREFQIALDPERMRARGVTLDQVIHAADESNRNSAGGYIVRGPTEWSIRAIGRASTVDELRQTVVTVKGPVPVILGDVADVIEAPTPRRGIAHRLKGEVVSCRVVKQFGADTVAVAARVRDALTGLEPSLPRGVRLRLVYDQSDLVRSALGGVGRAVLIGAVFVVFVLLLLMGNVRAALLVTVTIPWSFALAGLLLRWFEIGLNTMTLGGLAIAVGLLVDASIIVCENIAHRLNTRAADATSARATARAAALEAATEVGRPIAFATLIVIAVFSPLLVMSGVEGRMYQPLAAAVLASLASSLVLSLTVVPVMAAALLRPVRAEDEDVWLIRRIKAVYAPLLDWSLRHATLVRLVSLALTVPALWLGLQLGRDFMPKLDEGAFLLQTQLPPDASLAEVDRLNHRVEDVLREFPEVEDVVRRTGRAERTEDPMPHTLSDVLVVLKPDRTGRSIDELEEAMREALEPVPGVSVLFTTPLGMRIDEGLGGTPADLSVRIFGPDLDRLEALARDAERVLQGTPGLADVRQDAATRLPQIRIAVDRAQAARSGLAPGDIVRAVRVGLVGERFADVWVDQRRYDLVVRLREDRRDSLDALRTLTITAHDGTPVPLVQLARVDETFGPSAIRREAASRRIAVEASITSGDLAGVAADVRTRLTQALKLPPGYFFDLGGKVESEARATRALWFALALALAAVLVLLYIALGSLAETAVVLLTLPDAFVGAIVALALMGETWNVSSLVGLIGLLGIAVQNSLVLMTQTRGLVSEGVPFDEALRQASLGRVRPKLMTAATAILGLLPIVLLRLHGTEIERPLAIVMIGGLLTSTLFTLLALPTFYQLVHRLTVRSR